MTSPLPSLLQAKARAVLRSSLPEREWKAIEAWLGTFLPYQQEWVLDFDTFALLNKARQIGGSHGYAGAAALWTLLGETTTIVSVGDREANEVLAKVKAHLEVLAALGSEWAAPYSRHGLVRTASGGRCMAMPSTSGGRGNSGNIILDEFGYHVDPVRVWDGAAAVAMRGGRIRVLSTPNGVGNLWYELWTDAERNKGYRKHEVTIDQARADGLVVSDESLWSIARGNPQVFDQLFRCKFLDNAQQYIPSAMIEACTEKTPVYAPHGDTYAGLDIGRTADLTALVVVRLYNGSAHVIAVETKKRTESTDLENLAALAFGTFKCRRLCVDATGMGSFPAEQLQKKHGRMKVEPVVFTPASKEDLATTLYSRFSTGTVRLPANPPELRDDIASLRRIVTSAGNVRYDAPHTDKGHADRAWALALALHACARPSGGRTEIDGS